MSIPRIFEVEKMICNFQDFGYVVVFIDSITDDVFTRKVTGLE